MISIKAEGMGLLGQSTLLAINIFFMGLEVWFHFDCACLTFGCFMTGVQIACTEIQARRFMRAIRDRRAYENTLNPFSLDLLTYSVQHRSEGDSDANRDSNQ